MARTKNQSQKSGQKKVPRKITGGKTKLPPKIGGKTSRKSSGGKAPRRQKVVKEKGNKKKGNAGGIKKPHRYRPGTVALREIRRYQKSTNLLIQEGFLLVELLGRLCKCLDSKAKRCQVTSLLCFQEAAEAHLTGLFEASNERSHPCQACDHSTKGY